MSTEQQNNKEKDAESGKKAEEPKKDWLEIINDFIKNPVSTLTIGGITGFLINQSIANKKLEAEREEHKRQLQEKDDHILKLIESVQKTNNRLESTLRGLLGTSEENTLDLEQDPKDKVYRPKRKHYRLK